MNPTEELKSEHQAIKRMLQILDKMCGQIESGEQVDPAHLDTVVEFIRVFADKCHHGKEEDLLFPAMEEAGVPREGGPIGVMLIEHTQGRDYVKNMADSATAYKSGQREAAGVFAANARNYVSLLAQHIDKEDNILYPIADMHISNEKKQELHEAFARVEHEVIGHGRHEAFHEDLDRLEGIYLHGHG